jgi:uncharacterized protein YndB with AHSA1/START domain
VGVEPIAPYLEPLRRSVRVARPPAEAFELFTAGIGSWWPLATHSVAQARARTCVLEPHVGGGLYELDDEGRRSAWGRVLAIEPPHRLLLAWHPGRGPETAQELELRFVADGDGTRVELEHRGWQVLGERAAETRAGYEQGWGFVLGERFVAACARG